jgi:type I restriction enzyme S subunit
MASEWREISLGDVLELKRGYDLPQKDRSPGKVPLVSSSGVTDHHSVAMAHGPGVVTGRYGTLGQVFYIREDFWPLNTTLYVRDFKGNDPRFISYFLRSLDFLAYSDKAAVPGLNRNHLHQARVRIPADVSEQRAIAHILGTLDDKIELNRRMNETLEAMARALFKSWFVDFDPVCAKAEGRDPGLPKRIADLFPDSFEDSELGEIPKGWKVVPLPDVIDVNPPRPLHKGDAAPYLDMANMPTRGHSPDEVVDRPFGSGMRFVNGDTLVARITPCLENGKTAFVDFLKSGQVGWGSTEYIVLRPKPPLPDEFAYCLARATEFRDFAIQSMTGSSGRQRVPAESLSHFRVAVSTKPIAGLFGRLIKPLFARASAATKEGRALTALRDTLLPKLISGVLRVKDAVQIVEIV